MSSALHSKSYLGRELVQRWIQEMESEILEIALPAPLSDLITDLHYKSRTQDDYISFLKAFRNAFRNAEVGVIALGVPPGVVGGFTATSEHPIDLGSSTDNAGHEVGLPFADPDAFVQNFGARFKAKTQARPCCRRSFIIVAAMGCG